MWVSERGRGRERQRNTERIPTITEIIMTPEIETGTVCGEAFLCLQLITCDQELLLFSFLRNRNTLIYNTKIKQKQ